MVSALQGTGLDTLRRAIEERLDSGSSATVDAELLLLPRHENALTRASESLQASIDALETDPPELPPRQPEVVAEHARVSLEAFASLDGGLDPEEVLGVVFSRFCVGK
jgi:tRNA modification GTPase